MLLVLMLLLVAGSGARRGMRRPEPMTSVANQFLQPLHFVARQRVLIERARVLAARDGDDGDGRCAVGARGGRVCGV